MFVKLAMGVASETSQIIEADSAVFSTIRLDLSRTPLRGFGTTNSETVGSGSHSLRQSARMANFLCERPGPAERLRARIDADLDARGNEGNEADQGTFPDQVAVLKRTADRATGGQGDSFELCRTQT
jgi:hypothetical protein